MKVCRSEGMTLLVFALVNTALHYLFSYIGLSYTPSSRSTILDSMGGFLLIIVSGILFKDDVFNSKKIIGCILGFLGVVIINIAPADAFFTNISFKGDGMIFLNACCAAAGGIITKLISAVCFSIYNMLLAYHPISKVAIYNALIPILGVMFSSILLKEPFMWQYILAGGVVASGIYVINKDGNSK